MRTNIDIDDALIAEAMKATGAKTKKQAVEEGLRALIDRGAQSRFLAYRGKLEWIGDLDQMRRNRPDEPVK
jgi:Arc/MetJ family transcription regulator